MTMHLERNKGGNKGKQRGRFPLDSQFITYEGHQRRSSHPHVVSVGYGAWRYLPETCGVVAV